MFAMEAIAFFTDKEVEFMVNFSKGYKGDHMVGFSWTGKGGKKHIYIYPNNMADLQFIYESI